MALFSENATSGSVTARAIFPPHFRRTTGRSAQSGVAYSRNGGMMRMSTRCCTMCALNRK
jgi:hypothetical protein